MVERSGQTGALFVVGCAWERGAGMRIGARGGEGGWNEQERGTWSALATEKCVSGTRECVVGMEGCVFVLCGVLRVGGGSVDKACVGGEGGKEWEVSVCVCVCECLDHLLPVGLGLLLLPHPLPVYVCECVRVCVCLRTPVCVSVCVRVFA